MVVFVVAIAFIGFWQLPEQNIEDSELNESVADVIESTAEQPEVESPQSNEVVEADRKTRIDAPLTQNESSSKEDLTTCLLYTSPSPRDYAASRMPSSA